VVLTGGEPMLLSELIPLCERLRRQRRHVTIETAGTLFLPVTCNLMSISPKLSNSTPDRGENAHWSRRHERSRRRPEVVRRLMSEHSYQLKFVIDQPHELPEVEEFLAELTKVDSERVLLMPQGTTSEALDDREQWLRPYCEAKGYTFCPRKQIEWFGAARGT